jgi:hypothetical protein
MLCVVIRTDDAEEISDFELNLPKITDHSLVQIRSHEYYERLAGIVSAKEQGFYPG